MKSLVFLLITLTSFVLQALELKIDPSNELILLDSNSTELKRYKPGVVDEIVDADNQTFNLNYGEDVNGLMMAVLTPANENPTDISVRISAIEPAGVSAIEAGLLGKIQVNNKTVAGGMRWKPDSKPPYQVSGGKNSIITIYWRTLNTPAPSPLMPPAVTTSNVIKKS